MHVYTELCKLNVINFYTASEVELQHINHFITVFMLTTMQLQILTGMHSLYELSRVAYYTSQMEYNAVSILNYWHNIWDTAGAYREGPRWSKAPLTRSLKESLVVALENQLSLEISLKVITFGTNRKGILATCDVKAVCVAKPVPGF